MRNITYKFIVLAHSCPCHRNHSNQTHKEVDLLHRSFSFFCRWRRRYINYAKKANKRKAAAAAQFVSSARWPSWALSHNSNAVAADTRKKPLKARRLPHKPLTLSLLSLSCTLPARTYAPALTYSTHTHTFEWRAEFLSLSVPSPTVCLHCFAFALSLAAQIN